jgi:hypothetical protein
MFSISLDEIMVSRRMAEPSSNPTAGTLAWLCDPSNITGYNLYPDLKENNQFEEITRNMCELFNLDYYSTYRQVLNLVGTNWSTWPIIPNELIQTELYSNTGSTLLRENSAIVFQPSFKAFSIQIHLMIPELDHTFWIFSKKKWKTTHRANSRWKAKICSLLQSKVSDYNKSHSFLAEVIRATITAQKDLFPKLHHKIVTNDPSIYDAHALFYGTKYEMAKGKEKLLKNTKKSMEDLDIEVKNGTPLIGEYVVALNELAFKYRDSMALFWMLTYSVITNLR